MAVPQKSAVSARRQRRSSKNSSVAALNATVIPLPLKAKGKPGVAAVPAMPPREAVPLWLMRLCALQRHSSIVTFLLVASMLVVYGWTVYSQQLWSKEYRKLETLQRHERQLTTTNEVLKNQMALQAERPNTGLVAPSPASAIFLPPAPQNPSLQQASPISPATTPNAGTQQQPTSNPLAY